MSDAVPALILATVVILATLVTAFAALIYVTRTFARLVADITANTPDIHVNVPEPPAPDIHFDLTEPPTPAATPDPTLELPGYGYDPTDGTVPRINVDWKPDLDPEPAPYVPDPTDPTP
jgi:hypothetical protein